MRLLRKIVRGHVYWFAAWEDRDEDGAVVRRSKSLGLPPDSPRADAERLLFDARVVMATRKPPPPGKRITVGEYAEQYLARTRRAVRASTHERYVRYIARFLASVGETRAFADVEEGDVETWIREMERAGLAPRSVNLALACVRAMMRRATGEGALALDPMRSVRPARIARVTLPPYISPDVYMDAVDALHPSPRMRLACRLALFAGLRAGEIAGLEWQDVDVARGEIRIVSRGEGRETKSGRARTVPILPPVAEMLDAVPASMRRGRVIPSRARVKTVATDISRAWGRTVRRAAAADTRVPIITFHGLRHSFATWMASSGLPLASLQIVLGHADIAMTMRYVHVQPMAAADQVRAIARTHGL